MKIELNCINCKNNFETEFKYRDKKFCCRTCYFDYNKKNKIMGRKKDITIREKRNCTVCGIEFEVKKLNEKKICSNECRKIWNSTEVNKNKRLEASKKAVLTNHGVDSIFKKETFKIDYKNMMIDKYGVDNPMKHGEFVSNLKETLKEKQLNQLLPKLKNFNLMLLDEYSVNKKGNSSLPYNFKCLKCENIFTSTIMGSGKIPICRKCFPLVKNSKLEESVRDFLNHNSIKHLDNDRKILNGKEIDLFLEKFNLGIEVNGNYYHSELSGNKDKKYHLEKTKIANKKNIKLVHIFEDEILYKKDIVISRLSNLIGINNNKIFARKCVIKEVSKNNSKKFLNDNHIQGDSIDKIRLGLYYNNELVSLITFGNLRKSMGYNTVKGNYELLRFCNKLNTSVIGSFSKLLKYFITTYQPKKILTYADVRWSGLDETKTVYLKNGFNYIGLTPPNYWYLKIGEYNNRYHRYNFRKDVLVKEGFDPTLTEFEIMRLKGYDRIWDCGNMKFELNFEYSS
jgi:hypothetical protein